MTRVPGCPPSRADHIGSLLRPTTLRQAFREFHRQEIDGATFRAIQDEAIRAVVRLQEDVGLGIVNDGEYRRGSYWSRFVELTDGLGVGEAMFTFHDDHGNELDFTAPYVDATVRRGRPIAVDEVTFTRALTDAAVKVTLPAPSTMHFWRGRRYAAPGLYATPAAILCGPWERCTRQKSPTSPKRGRNTCNSMRSRSPCCAIHPRARR